MVTAQILFFIHLLSPPWGISSNVFKENSIFALRSTKNINITMNLQRSVFGAYFTDTNWRVKGLEPLKLHYVRFGDLETSLVEMCNCMQCVEEHFVGRVVFWSPSPSGFKTWWRSVFWRYEWIMYYCRHIFISIMLILR